MDSLERLAAVLDDDFRPVTQALTDRERAVVLAWQETDREYETIQRFLRTGEGSRQIGQSVETLGSLTRRGRTTRPIVAWHGLRSLAAVPGLAKGLGWQIWFRGCLAVSLDRNVARREFTAPPGRGGPAILKVSLPIGTPCIWIAGAGAPRHRYQLELLLPDRTVGTITEFEYDEDLPRFTVEVGA